MSDAERPGFVSGFVSLLGRPNAGKSTLMNTLVGAKLAIVARKPQTTRTTIQGVLTLEHAQIVFVDTPGIHKSDSTFNRRMMQTVRAALDGRDLLVFVADASLPFTGADAQAIDLVRKSQTPCVLALNKIDRLEDKAVLLPLIEKYKAACDFAEYVPVSARTGEGLEELKKAILGRLPEGPAHFPADYITDQPERFLAGEMVREKILAETQREVPHSVAVLIDQWDDTPRLLRVLATIYVEKEGQKAIVIGAKGAMLKRVGTLARLEMEKFFGRKVYLELFVKVKPKWRDNPEFLNQIDWRSMTEFRGQAT
jgi:GTP-binding protein Era